MSAKASSLTWICLSIGHFLSLNAELSRIWPVLAETKDPLTDAALWMETRQA